MEDKPLSRAEPEEEGFTPTEFVRILFVAMAAASTWFGWWRPLERPDVVALAAAAIGAWPIVKEAFSALLERRMTMELSMAIAFASALAIGEYFTALVIVLFVLVAEVLEHLTVRRGRRAIRDLLQYLPQVATVQGEEEAREVDIGQLRTGDLVLVKPGSRIPVDGEVVRGNSFVDQASITGESLSVEKVAGTRVFAGTINQSGALEVRTDRVGRDTAFGRIIEAVEHAEKSRAPIQKTADRLAGYLVYFAIGCALVTWLITRNMRSTISVVIVAGACGIAAGTPLAILGAVGQAARKGLILKGGLYLETLWAVDTVVLDKTGTLTFGNPEITAVRPLDGIPERELLDAAATAERLSEHPLAKAILRKSAAVGVSGSYPDEFRYTPGKGVVASLCGEEIRVGNPSLFAECDLFPGASGPASPAGTEVLVARGGRLLGAVYLADVLRPEAVQAVGALKAMGIRTVLLTGDEKDVAQPVGKELGVEEIGAGLLPDQKLSRIKELTDLGKKVAMVGDGVNDVPALLQASIGIAMGSGTDVARESAPAVLIGNDLSRLAESIAVARRCHRIIMTNLYGTLIVDGVGVGLSAFGLLSPLIAAAIHVTSELAFILNSARLLPALARKSR